MPQDMPPVGGYQAVQYKVCRDLAMPCDFVNRDERGADIVARKQRNLPARGFRPAYLLLGAGIAMTYGWYKLIHGIREQKYV